MPADRVTFHAYDLIPNSRIDLIPFTSWDLTDTLDRVLSLRATLPAFHRFATDGTLLDGATSIYVDHNALLRWGAIHWDTDFDLDESDQWTIVGDGHFSYYMDGDNGPRRTIDSRQGMTYGISTGAVNGIGVEVTFPNASQGTPVDMFDVVADLLAHAATIAGSANMGFDGIRMFGPGAATAHPSATGNKSGVTWSRTYWSTDYKGIGNAILEIAQSYPGFDWAVNYAWDTATTPPTPRRYFDLFYPRRGVARSGVVLKHGANVSVVRGNRSASRLAARLRGIGAGIGAEALVSDQPDATAIYPATRYPYTVGRFDAHEEALAANLFARTKSKLAVTRLPVRTFTVRVQPNAAGIGIGDVTTGDTCRLIINPPTTDFEVDDWYRVVQQRLAGGPGGVKVWELSLAEDAASTGVF